MKNTEAMRFAFPAFAALMLLLPALPVPDFWITQSIYIGLYAIVALGLVLLTGVAGLTSFGQAAFVGALSGLLIGPTTTVFYDSGFLIGLKGFVAAVFAGLSSYPLALVGALGVGLLESFGSFWASAFKEVIVFGSILPVLLWRSLRDPHHEEH